MKRHFFYIVLLLLLSSCFVLQNNSALYGISKTLPDTAFVYSLPFAKGSSYRVWQGYQSLLSHRDNFAIDFKMMPGTVVHAARDGVVVGIRDWFKQGGLGRRYVGKENAVVIRHSDGSFAHYLHLQYKGALVKVGDTVQQGQPIARSGHTGFSAFPHLHFEVTEGQSKAKKEIPVRFKTEKGIQFLQPFRRYKAL